MSRHQPMSRAAKRAVWISAAVTALVLVLDQWLKIWVKTSFYYGEDVEITPWFHLVFVQNPGMAFGWSLGSKLALTLFRMLAVGFGVWYLCRIVRRRKVSTGLCVSISLILAGALGNLIDCMFYGMIFNNPQPPYTATLLPEAGGYAGFLHGQVVDMLYFPLVEFNWPDWMPFVGGEHFEFFHPIFNIADAAVTAGVILLLFFYSGKLSLREAEPDEEKTE